MKNKFRYEGIILDCDDNTVKINDAKIGEVLLALDEISTIMLLDNDEVFSIKNQKK